MKPVITVLMTVYNGMPYLREAIESVLKQSFEDFEFLIIDDASPDSESVETILEYAGNDDRIRFIQNEKNIGQTASLNKGLQLAEGVFIARLDQDDVCMPARLYEQLDYFHDNPDMTIISSWEKTIDSSGRVVRTWKRNIDNYGKFLGMTLLGLCPVWHPSVMFRKSDIMELGGYDVSYGPAEDYELWSRIALTRKNAGFVKKYHLLQRVHEQRQSVLFGTQQNKSGRRAHRKAICQFISDDEADEILDIIRLNESALKLNKNKVIRISRILNLLISNVNDSLMLDYAEESSFRNVFYIRIGLGFRVAPFLNRMPDRLFMSLFYFFSPMFLPGARPSLSRMYNYIVKIMS